MFPTRRIRVTRALYYVQHMVNAMSATNAKSESLEANRDIAADRDVLKCEADAIYEMAEALGEEFSTAVQSVISARGRVICVGIGKSAGVVHMLTC